MRRRAAFGLSAERSGGGADRGSATVWSVGAVAVLCVVFGVVLALGQAVVARHRAAGGADMAALAAADRWATGGTAACAEAERVARAQGTRLVRCVLTGQVSDVTAASGTGPFAAEVRARAGPATDAPVPVPTHARAPTSVAVPVPARPLSRLPVSVWPVPVTASRLPVYVRPPPAGASRLPASVRCPPAGASPLPALARPLPLPAAGP